MPMIPTKRRGQVPRATVRTKPARRLSAATRLRRRIARSNSRFGSRGSITVAPVYDDETLGRENVEADA